ncbi:alpha-L-fucosidase [Brachybacterium tyrofermentans]|uniref:alpha-L-fucosidase n=1 Tax=Brachybacterium tyrofermentans TaxID=47848 RepID=UPI003FD1FF05
MISFDDRHGPEDAAPPAAYPDLSVPDWYRDAKLGVFVHWGLFSVPAWADVLDRSDVTAQNAYARHQYAEWYANTVRIAGSPTRERHERLYGVGHSYEDFADDWHPAPDAAAGIVDLARRAGARYVVPTTKHHDGFCLWDSATTPFTAVRRGPSRDLIAEIADAVRDAGLRLGLYYSGAHDWHASEFPALTSNDELFALRRNDPQFAAFAAAQLRELIERFAPDVLWNDIDWPDAGKYGGPDSLQELFRAHLAAVPDGLVDDRWGVPVHGVLTREYQDIAEVQDEAFESTRGLGLSFGFNADESAEHALDGTALIRLLADVVSKNGNLLINVGPRADGSIADLQARALTELGEWLGRHGAAIYGTRPWLHEAVRTPPDGVRFTLGADADGRQTLNVLLLDPAAGSVTLGAEVSAAVRDLVDLPASGAGPAIRLESGRLVVTPSEMQSAVAVEALTVRYMPTAGTAENGLEGATSPGV